MFWSVFSDHERPSRSHTQSRTVRLPGFVEDYETKETNERGNKESYHAPGVDPYYREESTEVARDASYAASSLFTRGKQPSTGVDISRDDVKPPQLNTGGNKQADRCSRSK